MSPDNVLQLIEHTISSYRSVGRDAFEYAALAILDGAGLDVEDAGRVRRRIAELAQTLPIVLTTSNDVAEAEQLCRQAADRLRGATGYGELVEDWPAPIAHEVQQLTALLAGEGRTAPAPEAALLQLRDTAETLVKLPAGILARRLIERDGEDAQEMRRRLAGVIGGSWNELARNAAARLRRAEPRGGPLAGIAGLFADGAPYRLMVEALAAARNRYLGHGALRANPRETAALVAWFTAARPGERPPLDAPATISLLEGLTAAVATKPWSRLRLEAVAGDGPITLTGAAALAAWQQDARHAGHLAHHDVTLPLQLAIDGAAALAISPVVAARICQECGRRDVFFFDTVYKWRRTEPAQIDFLDYGRGHKSRYGADGAPDLRAELAAVPAEAISPSAPDGGLGSGAAIARLDRLRIDLRYRSPQHLRRPLSEFLTGRDCGIYWLQAPAHVGKTTFVHGLAETVLGDTPIAPGLMPGNGGAIAAFYCKREYREGRITFLNGLAEALKDALDLRRDASRVFPDVRAVTAATEPRRAFVAWLDEWRALAPSREGKLLVVVDGLDEADPPGGDSLLDLLPLAAALTPGLYLLLTSRPTGEADCPAWLDPALTPLMAGEAAVTRRVGLDDPGYLDLLREYIGKILGEAATPEFADRLIAQAERRFVFVSFLVEQLRGGQVIPETLEALGTGAVIYDRFIDGLEARYGTKRADDLLMVLSCLAAAELAHGWIFGDGAVRDEATGGILEPLPREWPGLELDLLAAAAGMDEIADDGSPNFGAAFVEALILLQGALWVWRGEEGGARYRLGLKELAPRLAARRADAVTRAHVRLASLCLDAVAAIRTPLDAGQEPDAPDERTLRSLFPLLPGLVALAGSETLRHRYTTSPVVNTALELEARLADLATPSRRQVGWYSAVLAASRHDAGPALGNSERLASHASAYSNRGAVKTAAPGHGALAAIADYDAAITIREGLREAPGNDWPAAWRNGLANAYMHRGNAKMFVPGCGALAAIADYDAAIVLMEHLRDSLGERWPVPWRNHLAGAYVNRGIAELDAPGHGALAAIADYDAAIAIMEGLREALGKKWPQRWRNRLAVTYMSRGNAKVNASRYGALAAIADYDTAIRTMESLREMLGEDWPVPWRNELAGAYMNRGNAKMFVPGYGEAAIADYEAAIATMERLRQELSEKWPVPWRNSLAVAYMNRGNAYQSAAGHGASAAIADYDRAIAMMEELCEQLREEWPLSWRCDLGRAHFNRAQGYLRLGDRPRACCDAVRAENLGLELVRTAGEGPWSELISQASVLRAQACEAQTRPGGSLWERIRALVRLS